MIMLYFIIILNIIIFKFKNNYIFPITSLCSYLRVTLQMSALRSALVFQSTTTAISPMLLSNTRILLANSDRCGFRYICNSVTPGNRKDHYRVIEHA